MIPEYKGYKDVQIGEYKPLPVGGYTIVIQKAELQPTRSGGQMLVIMYDIYDGQYAGYYAKQYKASTKPDKKWPGIYYLVLPNEDEYGTDPYTWALRRWKAFRTALENSNAMPFNGDERMLKGMVVGAVMGREEYEDKDGKAHWSVKIRQFRSRKSIESGDFEIPEDKPLKKEEERQPYAYQAPQRRTQTTIDDFMPMDPDSDDDLPFD